MKHRKLLSLLLAVCMVLSLLPAVASADATPEVTLDLTTNDWGFPTTKTITGGEYSNGTYTITMGTVSSDGYSFNSSYLLFGKSGATLSLPAFSFDVERIVVTGRSGASGNTKMNVYVGDTAVSTETTGCQGTNTYFIDSNYQAAGTVYTLKVISNHNAQVTKIEIYKKSETPTPTYTVSFDANGGTGTMANVTTVSPYTLPACGFTAPEGKEFDYWAVDGDEGMYAPGNSYTLTGNTTFIAQWKDLPVVNYTDMMLKRVPANGDTVVIYYPKASKVMTAESYYYNNKKYELAAADATLTDNILAVPDEAVRLTVSVADGKYTFATADGKYLEADGTNVQLVSAQSANTLFRLETAAAGTDNYYIKCDSATYNGSAQYIEYYGGYFTVYSLNTSNTPIFTFQFFSEDGEGPTPETTYTVTLNPGDAEGDPQTIEDVTSPYTLPDCPFEAPEGCVFDGWQADNGDVFAAGTEVVLEEPITAFTATWKELEGRTYELVTSEDGLVDGGTYLIASELFVDELYLMSKQTSNNRAQYKVTGVEGTTLTLDESWIAANATDDLVFEFTLEDAEDGWAFHDAVTGGFLYAAGNETNKKNWLRTETELDDNGKFVIAYEGDDGATVPVAQGENTRGYMHYNETSDIFSCYAETSTVTGAVYLYKLVEDEPITLTDGYYLIGPEWTINDIKAENMFGENLNVGGEMLLATTLAVGDQIKVVKVENNTITAWYPNGLDNQYTVDAAHAGDVTIYFQQTYKNEWAEFGGYFYIQADYAITCVSGDHGLISTMAGRASAGTTVTIYVEPEEDYELDTLTVMCGDTAVETTKVSDSEYTFVMPAGDVTITATFALPATEPFFKSQNLILDGLIGVSFNMELPEISGVNYSTSYMTFSVPHGTCTERVDYSASKLKKSSQTQAFVCYVTAVMMAEPITATFHYTQNGTEKTVEKVYAVKDYFTAYDKIQAQFDPKTQTLIESVADYGHHVQAFLAAQKGWTFGENGDYFEMDKSYTESYDSGEIATAAQEIAFSCTPDGTPDFRKLSFALVCDSATEMRILFTVASGYIGTLTATVDGTAINVTELGTSKAVQIANIPAHRLSEPHTIVITTGNGSVTITASALAYVKVLLGAYPNNANATNAAAAIYGYSAAADAYMAN